jgi:hypothetical protein
MAPKAEGETTVAPTPVKEEKKSAAGTENLPVIILFHKNAFV